MANQRDGMRRRAFLKSGLTGMAGLAAGSAGLAARPEQAAALKNRKIVTRTLGQTGLKLPVISMGVMNADNPNLVKAALDSGIVHLDTANGYQRGRNEEMIGGVIKGRPRDSYVIATKVQPPGRARGGGFTVDTRPEPFLETFDVSLSRLGLEYVEILYAHSITRRDEVLFEPLHRMLEAAKKSGKARFVGLSTHGNEPEVIRAAVESKAYDVVLTAYNFRQDYRTDLRQAIAQAAAAGIGIVGMKPLAGAYWDKEKQEPINTQAALKWVLSDPNVGTVIPGMTTFDQLESDLAVMENLELTEQEKKDLRLGEQAPGGLYCQGCGGCLAGCPVELPIPSLMRSYMYAYGYKNLQAAHDLVSSLDLPPAPCGSCSACSVKCAKGFDVRDRIQDIVRLRALAADFLA